MRGACVPWAPINAASFLVRHACRQAHKDHGWNIFFAYSDPTSGEIGTIYQAANWHYIGQGLGRRRGKVHLDWMAPDGTLITSHNRNLRKKKEMFALGYRPVPAIPKRKYAWFEGTATEKQRLRTQCRYTLLPYPKRSCPAGATSPQIRIAPCASAVEASRRHSHDSPANCHRAMPLAVEGDVVAFLRSNHQDHRTTTSSGRDSRPPLIWRYVRHAAHGSLPCSIWYRRRMNQEKNQRMDRSTEQQDSPLGEAFAKSYLDGKFVVAALRGDDFGGDFDVPTVKGFLTVDTARCYWDELRRQFPDAEVRIIQGIYNAQDWVRANLGWL